MLVEGWRAQASAILQTFYAGMEGGNALADILFGDVSPSGRLPFTVARDAGDYPHFDRDANAITYDYWHGYAKLARDGTEPRYPFGHGLSYTRFARRALRASVSGDSVGISVAVANVGERSGDETVLCYIKYPGAIERWPLALKAFSRVSLAPGETRTIAMQIKIADLRYRDEHDHEWKIEPGEYQIHISGGIEADLKASVRL